MVHGCGLIEVPPDRFAELVRLLLGRKRVYLSPGGGVTFQCTAGTGTKLPISAIEVPKIDKDPLQL